MIWFNMNIQRCKGPFTPSISINSAIMLAILLSLETMGSLQDVVATTFQVTPLFSMRTVLLASSQSCRSVEGSFTRCVFVNATAIKNGLCGCQWYCSCSATAIITVTFVSATSHMKQLHTHSVQLQCVIYTKDMNRSRTMWTVLQNRIKNRSRIHIRSRRVNEPDSDAWCKRTLTESIRRSCSRNIRTLIEKLCWQPKRQLDLKALSHFKEMQHSIQIDV